MSNTTNGQHWHVRERKNDALKANRVFATRAEAEVYMRERHASLTQDESLTLYSGHWSRQRGDLGSFSFEPADQGLLFYYMYTLSGGFCDDPRCLTARALEAA